MPIDPIDALHLLESTRSRSWTNEHILIQAVLMDAFWCIQQKHMCEARRVCDRCDAISWILAPTTPTALASSYSFEYICDALDLDPDRTRAALLFNRYSPRPYDKSGNKAIRINATQATLSGRFNTGARTRRG